MMHNSRKVKAKQLKMKDNRKCVSDTLMPTTGKSIISVVAVLIISIKANISTSAKLSIFF